MHLIIPLWVKNVYMCIQGKKSARKKTKRFKIVIFVLWSYE